MIISHKHKFIFIKTRKTASTSIEIALSQICGRKDVVTPIAEKDEARRAELGSSAQNYYSRSIKNWFRWRRIYYHHISAREVKGLIGDKIWNNYYTFCVERNSFDKTVSRYFWRKQNGRYASLKEFLDKERDRLSDWPLYSDDQGEIMVDRVYQYAQLGELLDDLSQRFNHKIQLPDYRAKGAVRPAGASHASILNDSHKELIEECFAKEIRTFGYRF